MRSPLLMLALAIPLSFLVACEAATGAGDTTRPPEDVASADDTTVPPADTPAGPDVPTSSADVAADTAAAVVDNRIEGRTLLIVTTAGMRAAFEPLAEWRRKTGIPTTIATMEEIRAAADGDDDAETLRNYLKRQHTGGTEIVLLGGDTPLVPHRSVYVSTKLGFGELTYETDGVAAAELYFSDLDGDWDGDRDGELAEFEDDLDMRPDVAVGRVPARDATEAAAYVAKVLAYEQGAVLDYQQRVLLMSEPTGFGSISAAMMLDPWSRDIFGEGWEIRKLYDQWEPYVGAEENTLAAELASLEAGLGIVVHLGHGSEWSFAYLEPGHVDGLSNGPRYNVFFSCACYSGNFANDQDQATGERFVMNPGGGGVAYFGNTDIGIGFPSGAAFLAEILRLLLVEDPPRIGEALASSRATFLPGGGGTFQDEHADRYTQFVIDLLGDPAIRMWTGAPRPVSLNVPPTVTAGSSFPVSVKDAAGAPVVGVTVTAYQPDALLVVARTDERGEALLALPADGDGTVVITASGRDVLPAEAERTF